MTADSSKWTVLIVDDDPDNIGVPVQVLTYMGADVHTAHDGEQGMEILKTLNPTFVLLDLSMPFMDGWQMLKAIRANPQWEKLPVIAVTAHAMEEDKIKVMEEGFDGYVSKPYLLGNFLEEIERCLDAIDPQLRKDAKVDKQPGSDPDAKPAEAKPAAKPDARADGDKPAAKPDTQAAEAKSAAKSDTDPAGAEPAAKADTGAAASKPDVQADAKQDVKPAGEVEAKSEAQTSTKVQSQPDRKPGEQARGRSGSTTENINGSKPVEGPDS